MDKFLHKLFGLNHMNLFGWVAAGVVVIVGALFLGGLAFQQALSNNRLSPELLMMTALAVLLLGIFCVLLQIYSGLVVEKLQAKPKIDVLEDDIRA